MKSVHVALKSSYNFQSVCLCFGAPYPVSQYSCFSLFVGPSELAVDARAISRVTSNINYLQEVPNPCELLSMQVKTIQAETSNRIIKNINLMTYRAEAEKCILAVTELFKATSTPLFNNIVI